jgi:hypothetical protein
LHNKGGVEIGDGLFFNIKKGKPEPRLGGVFFNMYTKRGGRIGVKAYFQIPDLGDVVRQKFGGSPLLG